MKTLLYCYRSGVVNNALGLIKARVLPQSVLTAPPLTADTFPYHELEGIDLAYIVLHGVPGFRDVLFGDHNTLALHAGRINGLNLVGLSVVLEGCNGLKTNFPQAFLDAGARVVVASAEPTYDYLVGLGEAGRVGSRVVSRIRDGKPLDDVLAGTDFVAMTRPDSSVGLV